MPGRTGRAADAQARMAKMRSEDPASCPKIAYVVLAALYILVGDEEVEVSISEIADAAGEGERATHKGVQWLRDQLILDRAYTPGGKGHRAKTSFLNNRQVAHALRRREREYAAWLKQRNSATHAPGAPIE